MPEEQISSCQLSKKDLDELREYEQRGSRRAKELIRLIELERNQNEARSST